MNKLSVKFCIALAITAMVVVVLLVPAMPLLLDLFGRYVGILGAHSMALLYAYYAAVPAAIIALLCLVTLLRCILKNKPFTHRATGLLSWISWCCLYVVIVCGVAAVWYAALALFALAMLFVFFIVRVVRMCFSAAQRLKDENDLTI